MSSNIYHEEHDPIINLNMQPVRGILKSTKSIEQQQNDDEMIPPIGMTRSESRIHKIPHFDEMNIIATYHPIDKDYGHMKIDEPKTPYSNNENNIEDEMDTDETNNSGVDPNALIHRLNQSSNSLHLNINCSPQRSFDGNTNIPSEELEHRKEFENHRKKHYNEFEIVRLHKKEIEAELRALEQEETGKEISSSNDSSKPI